MKINGSTVPSYGQIFELGDVDNAVLETVLTPYTDVEVERHIMKVREMLAFPNENNTNGLNAFASIRAGQSAYYTIENLDVDTDKLVQASALKENPLTAADFSAKVSTSELVPADIPERVKAVHQLYYSQWNPPPAHLSSKGHIAYLSVSTLEGEIYHIVAHTSGFYVSNSTAHWFDPSPKLINGEVCHNHSLFQLLKKLSPHVSKTLEKNREIYSSFLPQATIDAAFTFLHSPWLVKEPTNKADLARSQQHILRPLELNPASRDWNEEFQSVREMEKDTFNGRLLRDRLLNKTAFEFAQAASHGVVGILEGSVQPLNPFEQADNSIYLHEGIFYSFATDAIGAYAEEGGEKASRYSTRKDLQNHNFINRLDASDVYTVLTTIVDYAGHRVIAQAPVPGIFRPLPEGETQIKYGSIDNNVAIGDDESFVEPLSEIANSYHLAKHAAFDNSGKEYEIVTPSSLTGVLGTDGRKYVLDLQRLTPLDLGFLDAVASDEKNPYPHSVPLLRPEAIDFWWRSKAQVIADKRTAEKKAEHKKAEPAEKEEKKEEGDDKEAEQEKEEEIALTYEERFEVTQEALKLFTLNPDVPHDLSKIPEGPNREQYEKDGAELRSISTLVVDKIIPKLVEELKHNLLPLPFDGAQLTSILHRRGINMRYLGQVAKLVSEAGEFLKPLHGVITVEIISRATKHVINSYTTKYKKEIIPYVIAQIFNALLGYKINASPQPDLLKGLEALYDTEDFEAIKEITVEKIRDQVAQEARSRFRAELSENWIEEINLRALFRETSLKSGIQWKARDYDFAATEPYYELAPVFDAPPNIHTLSTATAPVKQQKKKKSKNAAPVSSYSQDTFLKAPEPFRLQTLFHHTDVLNIVPIIKYSQFRSSCAEDALEMGRIAILKAEEKEKESSLALLNDAVGIYEQVFGGVHIEVARTYLSLAVIYHETGDAATARLLGTKAAILYERCVGIDAAETLHAYQQLSLFEYGVGNTAASFALIKHVFKYMNGLWSAEQPDSITTISNLVTMLHPLGLREQALELLNKGVELTEKFFGKKSAHTATAYHQIAQYQLLLPDLPKARETMRAAYEIFNELLGEEDPNTVESKKWADSLDLALKDTETRKNGSAAAAAIAPAPAAKDGAEDKDGYAKQVIAAALRASGSRKTKTVGAAGAHRSNASIVGGAAANGKKGVQANGDAAAAGSEPPVENMSLDDLVRYINGGETGSSSKSHSKKHRGKK